VKGAKSESEASEGEAEEGEAEEGEVAVMAAPNAAAEKVTAPAKKRGPKKLADMTPEERAKHDAGVAERKAKKNAGAAALEAAAKAAAPILPSIKATPLMVGGGATPTLAAMAAMATPVLVATPVPEEDEDEDAIELKIFQVDGQKYLRPWSSSANDWATGDLWYTNKKGEKAAYWGELMEDGSVNADAEEPPLA
jgi:hypothetical protein